MPKRKLCRKIYKELRDNFSKEQVLFKSRLICKQVLSCDEYKNAKTVFAYYPLRNEVNCLPIIEHALENGKQVVLPKCNHDCQMDFYEIKSLADVEEGYFHVMEPKVGCKLFLPLQESEKTTGDDMLVLVPGVVFDRSGNRYGYGKGYYDRYFERFGQLKRVALAYTVQLSEKMLDCLSTDIKMHVIVTEDEVIYV